ncbi:unnamed protein product [Moneuplotes crassus]|uniref:Uncharacterized protein n=1 Tax=Euplotes crassus TaxID=5936 RepID=A0AAD1Y2J8_EUPCR|nr:unnamed protein product [Moneuplotes crassus]
MNNKARAYKGYQRLSSQKKAKRISKVVATARMRNPEKVGGTSSKKFHYFDKKNSLGSNIPVTMRKKDAVDISNRNTVSLLSQGKELPTEIMTPKNDFLNSKSKVSLLGHYTSSATMAKSKKARCKLHQTKEIFFPVKSGGSMYPLNISNHSLNGGNSKGQTMDLKSMAQMNLTAKLNKLQHSSTTKCLNDSIGSKMKNCLKNRNSNQSSEKNIFGQKRKSQVNVMVQKASPENHQMLYLYKNKKNEIARLHKKLKKASKNAKVIKSTIKNSKIERNIGSSECSYSPENLAQTGYNCQHEREINKHMPYESFIACANGKKIDEDAYRKSSKKMKINKFYKKTKKDRSDCKKVRKTANTSYTKAVPIFSSRLMTKESKEHKSSNSSNRKSNTEIRHKERLWENTARNISPSGLQKIEFNISDASYGHQVFGNNRDLPKGMKCLKKVNSEVRQYKNRYNDDSPDKEEPMMDSFDEDLNSDLDEAKLSYVRSDDSPEDYTGSGIKNKTQNYYNGKQFSGKKSEIYEAYNKKESGSTSKVNSSSKNFLNLADGLKYSLISHNKNAKASMFPITNNESSELRKTTKRAKIARYPDFHKSDEETQHFNHEDKIEELLNFHPEREDSDPEKEIHLTQDEKEVEMLNQHEDEPNPFENKKSNRYNVQDSVESRLNIIDQLSFTNQDGASNMFLTITDRNEDEKAKNTLPDDPINGPIDTVFYNDTSIGNPLEHLTSENDELSKMASSEKYRVKAKRSETCPNMVQIAKRMNENPTNKENAYKDFCNSESKGTGKKTSRAKICDDKSSIVNFDTSFVCAKVDKSDSGTIVNTEDPMYQAVLACVQSKAFESLSASMKAKEICKTITGLTDPIKNNLI